MADIIDDVERTDLVEDGKDTETSPTGKPEKRQRRRRQRQMWILSRSYSRQLCIRL